MSGPEGESARGPEPFTALHPMAQHSPFSPSDTFVRRHIGPNDADISSMLALRADGHMPVSSKGETDCSHWCLPGAYDIGAQLLYNALEGRLDSPLAPLRGQVKAPALPPGAHHHVPRARRLSARKRRPGHPSGPQTAHTSSQLIESQPE